MFGATKYTPLRLEHEEAEYGEKHQHVPRGSSRNMMAAGIIVLGLICVVQTVLLARLNAVSVLLQINDGSAQDMSRSAWMASYQALGENKIEKLFQDNKTFIDTPPGPELDALERSLFTKAAGLVSLPIEQVEEAKLWPSAANPWREDEYVYRMAVFHDIHCLTVVRHAIQVDQYIPPGTDRTGSLTTPHINHCLGILRQALLCNPNLTLLPTKDTIAPMEHESDYKDLRTCHNWDAITEWTENHGYQEAYKAVQRFHPELMLKEDEHIATL